MDLFSL